MWKAVQSHQLVKLNYRCRIHRESFITSHHPPQSPTASSLFGRSAPLKIHPINVIAGDCVTQSSTSLKSLLRSMPTAPILLLSWQKIIPACYKKQNCFKRRVIRLFLKLRKFLYPTDLECNVVLLVVHFESTTFI